MTTREQYSALAELLTADLAAEARHRAAWNGFLDAYSLYICNPTALNAAGLKLAGDELESVDAHFRMAEFATRLGWDLKLVRLVDRLGQELPAEQRPPRAVA